VNGKEAEQLRVLFAVSEFAPWVKTGGLGDVAGALSNQVRRDGIDVRVVMPAYRAVLEGIDRSKPIAIVPRTELLPEATVIEARLPEHVPAYLIDCPSLYDRGGGPYQDVHGRDFEDNAARFALLSRAAAQFATAASPLPWHPDILHCHDWQTAPAAALVRHASERLAKTLLTIHNLAFQGVFEGDLTDLLGLPRSTFAIEGIEYYGRTSFMKAGIVYADRLSTVSPTYAREIQRAPLGMGLEGVLAQRSADLVGVLNGIDDAVWDPARDPLIEQNYDADSIEDKARNKEALQRQLGLAVRPELMLFGVVTRLTEQKGSDLIAAVTGKIAGIPAQLAVLGTGEPDLERAFVAAAAAHPGAIATKIGFDETLAHRIEAGADAFLMPSRFEPCGLNQMYSQRYGTPPIAHATGGLVDSIVDAMQATITQGDATGFLFYEATPEGLWSAIERAHRLFATSQWRALQLGGMRKPSGWSHRAHEYAKLYRGLVGKGGQ
jgi:starch synthase